MEIQSLWLTHISRTGTFGQNDLLLSPPTSHCRQPHRSPNEHPPLGMLVWLLDFFFNYKYKLLQILTHFLFYYVYLFVYMGGTLMHACGGHTHCVLMTVLTSYSSPAPLWDPGSNSGCQVCLEVSLSAICRATSSAPFFLFNTYVQSAPGSTRRYLADRYY